MRYLAMMAALLATSITTAAAQAPSAAQSFARRAAQSFARRAAHWMWYDEGNPIESAPAGKVWFRREVRASEPSTGAVRIAADEPFILWVNGRRVGEGDGGKPFRFNLNGIVETGPNVIAVEATNEEGKAGLYVEGEVRGQSGRAIAFHSGPAWLATREMPEADDWLKPGFAADAWRPARDLGPHALSPWKSISFSDDFLDRFQLAEGFEIERIGEPELVGSLVAMTWGLRGRLLISRERGPIGSAIDDDGDGVYDRVSDYSNEVTNCQGLCMVGDELYAVGNGPDGAGIYRLSDRDHDDRADDVQLVVKSKGGMGEHGPHDVVVGPDGWLYHNLGNHAGIANAPEPTTPVRNPYEGDLLAPRFEDGNGHAAGIKAPAGSVWRFSPDGRRWWLTTAGFRNEYDVAFNSQGDLFTFDSDMEWDVGQPWYRPVRVHHCIPGAEFGWRSGTANWPEYYFDSLPATVNIGRGSPTGVVFYEHRQLPERYAGSFLVCDWSMGRIIAVHLQPTGASFKATWETLVRGNPLNVSDVEVDRDGSVVFCTGGRNTEGGLYRLTYGKPSGPIAAPEVKSLEDLLALPQPQAAWARESAAEWKAGLGESWGAAVFEKARQGSAGERLRALSLLAQLGPRPTTDLLLELVADADAQVRAFACWLLGDRPEPRVAAALAKLLADDEPRVQRRACEAFVLSGLEPPAPPLIGLLASSDRWLRFAARLALQRVPAAKWRELVLGAKNLRVQVEGLLALSQLGADALPPATALERELALLESRQFDPALRLDVLRVVELTLLVGDRSDKTAAIGKLLLEQFPTGRVVEDVEAARIVAVLDVPGVVAKLIAALQAAGDQSLQLHYALALAYVTTGWDLDSQRRLLDWYETTQSWEGGHSLRANIDNIVGAALARATPHQRRKLVESWRRRPFAARLVLRASRPDQIESFDSLVAEMMAEIGRQPQTGEETVALAIDALAKSGSAESQNLMRTLYEDHPDRREQLARVLAQHPSRENWQPLVRSLQFGDNATLQLCLGALRKIDRKPVTPEEFRTVIIAGLKLGDQGGLAAAELLQAWTGSRHEGGLKAGPALEHYQAWFGENYPNAQPPELPQVTANDVKYTYQQLLQLVELPEATLGDAKRGEQVFTKANCIKCHRFLTKGEAVGPDLSAVRRRFQRKEIIESITYPSQVVSDQYRSVTIETKEGQIFTGMPATQEGSDKIVLLLSDATKLEIARRDVESLDPVKLSVMPEGLLKDLSPDEVIDLFAFLETSKNNELTSPH